MKFSSMREYFYKVHNILYVTFLFPLLLFTYLYLENRLVLSQGTHGVLAYLLTFVFLAAVGFARWDFVRKIKAIRQLAGLGVKLEKYATALIIQFAIISAVCLMLVVGLWLTASQIFVAAFVVSLIILSWLWPTGSRVCKDLRLRGDERDMVLHKRDAP